MVLLPTVRIAEQHKGVQYIFHILLKKVKDGTSILKCVSMDRSLQSPTPWDRPIRRQYDIRRGTEGALTAIHRQSVHFQKPRSVSWSQNLSPFFAIFLVPLQKAEGRYWLRADAVGSHTFA